MSGHHNYRTPGGGRFVSGPPAAPCPVLPRRIAADYCTVCGNAGEHWHGCPASNTRPTLAGRLTTVNKCTPRLAGPGCVTEEGTSSPDEY